MSSPFASDDRTAPGRTLSELGPFVPGLALAGLLLAALQAWFYSFAVPAGDPRSVALTARAFLAGEGCGAFLLCVFLVYGTWWRLAGDRMAVVDALVFLLSVLLGELRVPGLLAALQGVLPGASGDAATTARTAAEAALVVVPALSMTAWFRARHTGMRIGRGTWTAVSAMLVFWPLQAAGTAAGRIHAFMTADPGDYAGMAAGLAGEIFGFAHFPVLAAIAGTAAFFGARNLWKRERGLWATVAAFASWQAMAAFVPVRDFVLAPFGSQELDVLIPAGVGLFLGMTGLVLAIFAAFKIVGAHAWRPNDRASLAAEGGL